MQEIELSLQCCIRSMHWSLHLLASDRITYNMWTVVCINYCNKFVCFAAPQIRFTILALYKFSCMYVCKSGTSAEQRKMIQWRYKLVIQSQIVRLSFHLILIKIALEHFRRVFVRQNNTNLSGQLTTNNKYLLTAFLATRSRSGITNKFLTNFN